MTTTSHIELIIPGREKDLGGFKVRRVLPFAHHRMVGPFIFFDHMGPAELQPGEGMSVRPHPHMNLATVTYLFEGKIRHRDSLGSDVIIEPGAINWMIAGRGIVHSERTPDDLKNKQHRVNGIQLWVAVPEKDEEGPPSFSHHGKESLPEFQIGKVTFKLLLGSAFDRKSPVPVLSDMFYVEVKIPKGEKFILPSKNREAAVYVVNGLLKIEDQQIQSYSMSVAKNTDDIEIEALEDSHIMFLGGAPVGLRNIFWNFVSSSKERIEAAKKDWATGPQSTNDRFFPIPGDDQEFTPLPNS